MMKKNKWIKIIIIVFGAMSCVRNPVMHNENNFLPLTWVEIAPHAQWMARTIIQEPSCPKIFLDQKPYEMELRVKPSKKFPIWICEKKINSSVKKAEVFGKTLTLPHTIQKILVVADTGCRIKTSKHQIPIQDCSNSNKWLFPKIMKKALQHQPDLVVHIGDYLYRESPCPKNMTFCQQSAWGDQWQTWKDDFFEPASELLRSTPWVFVRGNHESCERAGEGWFRLLDPNDYSPLCKEYSEPYLWQANGTDMMVLDTSEIAYFKPLDPRLRTIKKDIQKLQEEINNKKIWIWSHHPFWGFETYWTQPKSVMISNVTLQSIAREVLLPQVQLILSGHVHLFGSLSFDDQGPAQLILGNGGTSLSHLPQIKNIRKIEERTLRNADYYREFGYYLLEAQSQGGWKGISYSESGKKLKEHFW